MNGQMIPVHRFMPSVLAGLLVKAPLTPEKVAFAWRTAVGGTIDRVSSVRLEGHTLHVHTRDAAWQREIERSAALICARLEALLGTGIVKGLEVTRDP